MRKNTAKARMLAGRPAIGGMETLGSPLAAGLLSQLGYDLVLVDNQHGAWSDADNMHAFHQISLGPAVPMARVQENNFYAIGRLLDRGAMGIVVPMVNNREDAEGAARAMRYPPRGSRSVGAFGVAHYGSDYTSWIDDEVFLAVQIETAEALQNLEEILSVEGVDGCWVGPGDLSNSLGTDLGTADGYRRHEEAVLQVLEACRKTGKVPGIAASSDARRWLEKGFLFVTVAPDSLIVRERGKAILEDLRRDYPG